MPLRTEPRQLILVLRECVTSFTATTLLEDERHHTLRDAIIRLCIQMRPLDGPPAVVRTDPAPGFKALTEDQQLKHHRITLDLGHPKNRNKNPVAERAVQEFENELLRHDPLGGPVSLLTLAVASSGQPYTNYMHVWLRQRYTRYRHARPQASCYYSSPELVSSLVR